MWVCVCVCVCVCVWVCVVYVCECVYVGKAPLDMDPFSYLVLNRVE